MKVIFIGVPKDCDWQGDAPELKEGNPYTVINTVTIQGISYHELSGFSGWGYYVRGFIPCSNIDEKEMVRDCCKNLKPQVL